MQIVAQNENWVIFNKPSGVHIHQPESGDFYVPQDLIAISIAHRILKKKVYPVHRLDVGTTGLLLMALNQPTASFLSQQFQNRTVEKTYITVVRGWPPPEGRIEIPLELDSTQVPVESITIFKTLSQIELPHAVGRRHKTARYSLLQVAPKTGRYHQIRRHLNRISHPVIGDATHGDSHHNRFFREVLNISGLCLQAKKMTFMDKENQMLTFECPDDEKWQRIHQLFTK